jgi:hypothetical protein
VRLTFCCESGVDTRRTHGVPGVAVSLEVVEMSRWFNRMRPSHRAQEPVAASVAQIRIPAPAVGDRMAFIPAQRDRRAHSSF